VNITTLVERHWEMNQVKVKVVEAELSQAVVESAWDILGAVLRVPQLGCDEDVLALKTAVESLLERLCDFLLVAVDLSEVEMAVAGLEGLLDGGTDLARLSLPRAETQLAAIESVSCVIVVFAEVLTGCWRQC
jgi:hypothetical protein